MCNGYDAQATYWTNPRRWRGRVALDGVHRHLIPFRNDVRVRGGDLCGHQKCEHGKISGELCRYNVKWQSDPGWKNSAVHRSLPVVTARSVPSRMTRGLCQDDPVTTPLAVCRPNIWLARMVTGLSQPRRSADGGARSCRPQSGWHFGSCGTGCQDRRETVQTLGVSTVTGPRRTPDNQDFQL